MLSDACFRLYQHRFLRCKHQFEALAALYGIFSTSFLTLPISFKPFTPVRQIIRKIIYNVFYSITSNIQMNFANLNISRRMHKLKEIGKTLGLVSEFYSSNVSIFTTIFSNQILKQNSRDFDESNFENVNLVSIYQQFKFNYIQLPSVGES